ncbi:hypothetical protein EDC04DRAFT_2610796 [Pisolithus marmoratus]|nr:hypothetical protein EDC04DRAFT_2610796 [Pisolithus marmoratus]
MLIIAILIASGIQLVRGEVGSTYEIIILLMCMSLANTCDPGKWLGAPSQAIFNFSPRRWPAEVLLNIEEGSATHLAHVSDWVLVECLKDSVGYYHKVMDNQDICIVEWLFQSGTIQVLVISKYYEGREHCCVDYHHVCQPMEDKQSQFMLMFQQTCRDCHKFILLEGLPIQSHLLTHPIILCHYFPAEIVVKTIENKQDTMNYYNLHNVSHQHLSDHLSEPVENTLQDLSSFKIYDCVPVKLDCPGFEAPHFKMFILLQAHFSRIQLPVDLTADQALVLKMVLNVLSAYVDVMSSHAWLNALGAMDLSQMYVWSVWEMDCPLKQSPHFTTEKKGIESVYDIMEMEDDKQNAFLQIDMWKA